jgi:kumamolisin
MSNNNSIALTGSERKPLAGAKLIKPVGDDELIRVTIVLHRRAAAEPVKPAVWNDRHRHTSAEFGAIHGADYKDFAAIEKFAHENGLTVVERHHASRRLVLVGPASAMQKAFGTQLAHYEVPGGIQYRGRTGSVNLPTEIRDSVMAVLGLDNRPVAKPHFRRSTRLRPRATGGPDGSFTPPQLAQLYNFPAGPTGAGQTIAIIELGGGYSSDDLATYFSGLQIADPSVTAVSVDNGANSPGSDADGEVMLDIEVAGAVAPGAQIAVYFAPNTDQGFTDAIAQAVHDTVRKPSIVSISWGGPEDSWTPQARDAMNAAMQDAAALGVTITVAAGDDGSTDGEKDGLVHTDFPASSPFALACGGTSVQASNGQITSEQVWNELANQEGATGGGVSAVFPLPTWQQNANVPKELNTGFVGRGVPDVSGDADPSTGYQVLVDGQNQIIGGTSAVAPLWAGLVALLNQQLGQPVGFINPVLYQLSEAVFNDITQGNNPDYSAGPGWDPCTGVGSPNGAALLQALQAAGTGSTTATPNTTAKPQAIPALMGQ